MNGDTATVEFSSSGPAATFGAVLMARVSLHVSCASYVHECNNNIDNYCSFLINLGRVEGMIEMQSFSLRSRVSSVQQNTI